MTGGEETRKLTFHQHRRRDIGIDNCRRLVTIRLNHNPLGFIESMEGLHSLRAVDFRCCLFRDVDAIKPLAANLQLRTVKFHGTPLAKIERFRAVVCGLLGPNLEEIDGKRLAKRTHSEVARRRAIYGRRGQPRTQGTRARAEADLEKPPRTPDKRQTNANAPLTPMSSLVDPGPRVPAKNSGDGGHAYDSELSDFFEREFELGAGLNVGGRRDNGNVEGGARVLVSDAVTGTGERITPKSSFTVTRTGEINPGDRQKAQQLWVAKNGLAVHVKSISWRQAQAKAKESRELGLAQRTCAYRLSEKRLLEMAEPKVIPVLPAGGGIGSYSLKPLPAGEVGGERQSKG